MLCSPMLRIFALSLLNFEAELVTLERRLAEAHFAPRIIAPPTKHDEADCWTAQIEVGIADLSILRAAARKWVDELNIDIAVLPQEAIRSFYPRLAVFDMDSTLIEIEVIDELAKLAGVGPQVSAITAAAMRGEFDFQESCRRRVGLLVGLEKRLVDRFLLDVPITPGAKALFAYLQRVNCRTAVVSGGFDFIANQLQRELGINEVFTNRLTYSRGKVSGVDGEIVDATCKASTFKRLAKQCGVSLDQTLGVGDGANDVPMLALAGLSVGFRPKPVVREKTDVSLMHVGLDGILPLLTACGATM
jgi:phosphoserine phosphatase